MGLRVEVVVLCAGVAGIAVVVFDRCAFDTRAARACSAVCYNVPDKNITTTTETGKQQTQQATALAGTRKQTPVERENNSADMP